jgi:hypothetical protein
MHACMLSPSLLMQDNTNLERRLFSIISYKIHKFEYQLYMNWKKNTTIVQKFVCQNDSPLVSKWQFLISRRCEYLIFVLRIEM